MRFLSLCVTCAYQEEADRNSVAIAESLSSRARDLCGQLTAVESAHLKSVSKLESEVAKLLVEKPKRGAAKKQQELYQAMLVEVNSARLALQAKLTDARKVLIGAADLLSESTTRSASNSVAVTSSIGMTAAGEIEERLQAEVEMPPSQRLPFTFERAIIFFT